MYYPPFHVEGVDGPVAGPDLHQPFRTAAEAATEAPRAVRQRETAGEQRREGREWVQPAPCVAATSYRSTGSSRVFAPSKRWSTAGSP